MFEMFLQIYKNPFKFWKEISVGCWAVSLFKYGLNNTFIAL